MRIRLFVYWGDLGDGATEDDAGRYANYLDEKLSGKYPDADITITEGCGGDYVESDDLAEEDEARDYIKSLWDNCPDEVWQ